MSPTEPRRGEVWLAHVDKVRPVVVLTRDPMGRYLNSLIVAPMTTTMRGTSTEVAVGEADGARRPSVINVDSTQLVNRDDFRRRVGRVRPETVDIVCATLAHALGCDRRPTPV